LLRFFYGEKYVLLVLRYLCRSKEQALSSDGSTQNTLNAAKV
jgi:hypothetical protein